MSDIKKRYNMNSTINLKLVIYNNYVNLKSLKIKNIYLFMDKTSAHYPRRGGGGVCNQPFLYHLHCYKKQIIYKHATRSGLT